MTSQHGSVRFSIHYSSREFPEGVVRVQNKKGNINTANLFITLRTISYLVSVALCAKVWKLKLHYYIVRVFGIPLNISAPFALIFN